MASAKDHYEAAERLVARAERNLDEDPWSHDAEWQMQAAQLHATLAQVGATILAASAGRNALSYEHLFDVVKEL